MKAQFQKFQDYPLSHNHIVTDETYETSQVRYGLVNEASACDGDLGGPLVYESNNRLVCILGVASFHSRSCDNADHPAIFIIVSRFKPWIRRTLQRFHLHWANQREAFEKENLDALNFHSDYVSAHSNA